MRFLRPLGLTRSPDPAKAGEFRDLTVRIVGKLPERMTITLGGYVSAKAADTQAA